MITSFKTKLFVFLLGLMSSFFMATAQISQPTFHKFSFEDQAIITGMSDNGKYVVATGSNPDNTILPAAPKFIDLSTDAVTDLLSNYNSSEVMSASAVDVTDDASIVVGSFNGLPAYWSKSTEKWTILPLQEDNIYGSVKAVTPDGKFAVGMQHTDIDGFYSQPAMWDLTTGTLVETPGLPTKDMSNTDQEQNWFNHISPDGKVIVGCMSYSYPSNQLYYIYHVDKKDFTPIGFTYNALGKWTPCVEGLFFINSANLSSNGLWIAGRAYMVKEIAGSNFPNEYEVSYVYNVASGEFTLYDGKEDYDVVASAVDNNGHAFAATPSGSPIREWSVRNGSYWYGIDLILQQRYNYDFYGKTGYDNTGTPIFLSDDGCRIAAFVDPYTSYVLDLPVTFTEACEGLDLLGSYSTEPKAGSTISALRSVQITFEREIQVLGSASCAELRNADGTKVHGSVGFSAEGKTLNVRFRTGVLNANESYTLYIPAGALALLSDDKLTNRDINIPYNGRADVPVALESVYPNDGSSFAKIDYETSPLILTFDTDVAIQETAKAYLYRADDNEVVAPLVLAYYENMVMLYPSTIQYLYEGTEYYVLVEAGSITDVAGNGGNETIRINYSGSYVREIVYDDNTLFYEDCNYGLGNFMLYDGDELTPNDAAQAIGFDSVYYGWSIVWDEDNATNIAAASHSMYSPAGKSNDWMVIPQIHIPDAKCVLKFLSQSYLSSKNDYLKVYIWECDEVYNSMNAELTDRIVKEGTLVYNKLQTPGSDENTLAGDWMENVIDLAAYADKNIYIAFCNDNQAQSAVFVDDVQVVHNMSVRVAFTHSASVVAQENITIEGVITIDSETDVYNTVSLILKDNTGEQIDIIEQQGLSLKKGDTYSFAFAKPLSLKMGAENKFTIEARFNNDVNNLSGSVVNLAFQPIKRVILEEHSGRMCGNCPLGIVAIEKIQERFGDRFIPICIHTYGDDPLGVGLAPYTSFLGLMSAPSGVVNRLGTSQPAVSDINKNYYFSNVGAPEGTPRLWMDYVVEEMAIPANAELNIGVVYNPSTNQFDIESTARFALTADNLNISLFTVVLEDNLSGWQLNYFFNEDVDALGDWAKGGKYGQSPVYDYMNMDVCRSYNGLTFNGTGGYIPQSVIAGNDYVANYSIPVPASVQEIKNCKVVVVMIDANTNKVINAAVARDSSGVTTVDADSNIEVKVLDGMIAVKTASEATVMVYDINGVLKSVATGRNEVVVEALSGLAIVKVVTPSASVVEKVIVK